VWLLPTDVAEGRRDRLRARLVQQAAVARAAGEDMEALCEQGDALVRARRQRGNRDPSPR
jgi:hypothetical protein